MNFLTQAANHKQELEMKAGSKEAKMAYPKPSIMNFAPGFHTRRMKTNKKSPESRRMVLTTMFGVMILRLKLIRLS